MSSLAHSLTPPTPRIPITTGNSCREVQTPPTQHHKDLDTIHPNSMFHLRRLVVVAAFVLVTPWIRVESFMVRSSLDGRRTQPPRFTTRTPRTQPSRELWLVPRVVARGKHEDNNNNRSSSLHMNWFDKAFHGGGSANQDDLEDIWNTQQAILAARRGGDTKAHLKAKYKEPRKYFEVKATTTTSSTRSLPDSCSCHRYSERSTTTTTGCFIWM